MRNRQSFRSFTQRLADSLWRPVYLLYLPRLVSKMSFTGSLLSQVKDAPVPSMVNVHAEPGTPFFKPRAKGHEAVGHGLEPGVASLFVEPGARS